MARSESVRGVAEASLAECEHFGGSYRVDLRIAAVRVVETAVFDLVLPPAVPSGRPSAGEPGEQRIVGDRHGIALDDDVEPFVPGAASGGEDDVRVDAQVAGLLLGVAGGEVDGVVEPYRDQRGDMRPAVAANGGDPEQLGALERRAGLAPRR